jgi:uncharacterized protein YhhL (DUF1145 family)
MNGPLSDYASDFVSILFWNVKIVGAVTPYSRVLLVKLIVAQLVKKFRIIYGTQILITISTRARH